MVIYKNNQYRTNTLFLIHITIANQFVFYLRNHYWLLFVNTSLQPKHLTKFNHKTIEEKKDGPIYNNYWKIELGNTISKNSQNTGFALLEEICHNCLFLALLIKKGLYSFSFGIFNFREFLTGKRVFHEFSHIFLKLLRK